MSFILVKTVESIIGLAQAEQAIGLHLSVVGSRNGVFGAIASSASTAWSKLAAQCVGACTVFFPSGG